MTTDRRTVASIASIAAIALAACGGSGPARDAAGVDSSIDGGGDTIATTAPATARAACEALNEAQAQLQTRCLGGELGDWRAVAATTMDCARYARHVSDGLVEYRPAGWAACLAKYALPCPQADPYPCYFEILHGLVPDGQPCEDTDVCGTVSGCINLTGDTCGDVCVRLGNESEACGFYCGGATPCFDFPWCASGLTCIDGLCVKAKAAGQPCGGLQQIGCQFGIGCDVDPADPDGNGICVRPTAGGPCRSNGGCLATEFCLAGTCAPRRATGAPCTDAPASCRAWHSCDTEGGGTCVAVGQSGVKCAPQPGAATEIPTACISGTCDGVTCVPTGGPGAICPPTQCEQGTFCDPSTSTCAVCGP
jgi:hypothetical protein